MAADTLWIVFDIKSVEVGWIVPMHSAYLCGSSKDFKFMIKTCENFVQFDC